MEKKTVYLTLFRNTIKLFSIVNWNITVGVVALLHTTSCLAVRTATPESVEFTVL
jgi:hypothetical protein